MSFIAKTMLDMLFRVSTLKKSTVKMLVKMLGLRSWIFSEKNLRIHWFLELRGDGVPGGWVHVTILSHLLAKKGDKWGKPKKWRLIMCLIILSLFNSTYPWLWIWKTSDLRVRGSSPLARAIFPAYFSITLIVIVSTVKSLGLWPLTWIWMLRWRRERQFRELHSIFEKCR